MKAEEISEKCSYEVGLFTETGEKEMLSEGKISRK